LPLASAAIFHADLAMIAGRQAKETDMDHNVESNELSALDLEQITGGCRDCAPSSYGPPTLYDQTVYLLYKAMGANV